MDKLTFLYELSEKLSGLPDEDLDKSIEYYSEIIDDRMEEGISEEDAIAALGSIDDISSHIISEIPLPRIIKARFRPGRTLNVWEIILASFGFLIIGIPILAAVFSLTVSVIAAVFSVAAVFAAIPLALLAGGVAGIISFFTLIFGGNTAMAFLVLGAAILSLGLVIPTFIVAKYTTKFLISMLKWIALLVKKSFIRRK